MKYTPEAIELLKIFSSGVKDCPKWDEEHLEERMFYMPCVDIAKRKNKDKIDEDVVREYVLMAHNPITVKNGCRLNADIQEIKNCMGLPAPGAIENKWFCIHGTANVFEITKEEAELLKKRNKKLLEGL